MSGCRLPGVTSLVLEVRSRSGHHVPVSLHQTNVILCSDKEGQGPRAQLSPLEVQALPKRRGSLCRQVTLPGSLSPAAGLGPPASAQAPLRRQISAAGARRARSPNTAQLSSLRNPGSQNPKGPQAPQAAQTEAGPMVGDPWRPLHDQNNPKNLFCLSYLE